MKYCCKALVIAAVCCLGLLWTVPAAAGELTKWIPGDAVFYGKISGKVVRNSALFNRLMQKNPGFRKYVDAGREHIGNYRGDLDTAVFVATPGTSGTAVFLEFSQPYDPDTVAAGLAAKGMSDKYQKITIAGKNGYVLTKPTPQGRSCFLMLSNRVMMGCLESAAESILNAPKLSGTLLQKLQKRDGADIFLRAFPGGDADALSGMAIRDFDVTGKLPADGSLDLNIRASFAGEETARNAEQQIRQGMMILLGMTFADDGELGMEVISRIKISRESDTVTAQFNLPPDLVERLVTYFSDQAEKKAKRRAERARRREERRRQSQQLPASQGKSGAR